VNLAFGGNIWDKLLEKEPIVKLILTRPGNSDVRHLKRRACAKVRKQLIVKKKYDWKDGKNQGDRMRVQ